MTALDRLLSGARPPPRTPMEERHWIAFRRAVVQRIEAEHEARMEGAGKALPVPPRRPGRPHEDVAAARRALLDGCRATVPALAAEGYSVRAARVAIRQAVEAGEVVRPPRVGVGRPPRVWRAVVEAVARLSARYERPGEVVTAAIAEGYSRSYAVRALAQVRRNTGIVA